jgi:putative peptide zinc metalloprotease protein
MLLIFMPTLYCDVSDAWRLESRWQRILVSAAGMLVELVLASIATLLWWFSEPGLLHAICLRVMFLCSVSTLLFNANPLVRCDGYYILSDFCDVPNLRQESRWQWRRLFWSWLTGRELPADPTIPRRIVPWLMLYAALSTIYCWLLIGGILWFCFRILEPHGLASAAWLLAALVAAGLIAAPLRELARTCSSPTQRREIRSGRAATALVAITAILAAALFVPLPHRISAPLWIESAAAQSIYVTTPGRLINAVPAGVTVREHQPIGKLVSPEVELQVAELTAEVKRKELHLKNLRLILADDPSVAPLIPAEEKSLADAQQRLVQWQREQERLILKSPTAGTVLPPPILRESDADPKRLTHWRGTPLDPYNRGCYLETGSLVCLVGDPAALEAILVIEQSAVPFVTEGQTVRLRVNQGPVTTITGNITELAKTDAEDIPAPLAQALDLPLSRDRTAGARPAETYYQARVKLNPHTAPLLIGMHGHAKIIAPWQPLAPRLWRYLQRTFRV